MSSLALLLLALGMPTIGDPIPPLDGAPITLMESNLKISIVDL